MPRSIWRGAISFGLVAIPIKLYTATQSRDIPFAMLHNTCHNRVRQKRYCPYHGEDVAYADVTKGFEYTKDQYVVMEPSDFNDLPVPSKHTIEITRFVELPDIDPMYYERGYVLEPEPVGQKPFALLNRALHDQGRHRQGVPGRAAIDQGQGVPEAEGAPELPQTLRAGHRHVHHVLSRRDQGH